MAGRIGVAAIAAWPVLLAAPALAHEHGSAVATTAAPTMRPSVVSRRPIELRPLRLLPPGGRERSHRLVDAATVGPGDDTAVRARLRGVRLWEKTGDDSGFALGVSPVGGRLVGALRIVR